ARKFRALASQFTSPVDCNREYDLRTELGELIIEAVINGFLQGIPHLADRVTWHTSDGSHDPVPGKSGVQAVYCRAPGNLVLEIVGGYTLIVQLDTDGTYQIVDPSPLDGILPFLCPT